MPRPRRTRDASSATGTLEYDIAYSAIGMAKTLNEQFPCRQAQIEILTGLFTPSFAAPPVLVAYGLEYTGKTAIVKAVLEANEIPYTFVNSRECITGRHMLEQAVTACIDAIEATTGNNVNRSRYNRCESLNALLVHLQKLLGAVPRMTLVFDGIDKQREAPSTLLPALSRLGEVIPNLSIIFIVSVPKPRFLHKVGVPHVHFGPYSKEEAICILSERDASELFPAGVENEAEATDEDMSALWAKYLNVLWDSMGKGAARDLGSFTVLADKLWKPFVTPVLDGTYIAKDFSRLLVSRRALFQNEEVLIDSIIPRTTEQKTKATLKPTHQLPYYSKFLLCAAYLASFNPARSDAIHFMKSTEKRRRKKAGATAGRGAKNRKIARHLLSPSLFPLDRLLAILHAIIPHSIPQTAEIYTQIATLSSLRLLLRSGAAGGDVLDPACKWRVNFGLDYVVALGRTVGFELADHLASAE